MSGKGISSLIEKAVAKAGYPQPAAITSLHSADWADVYQVAFERHKLLAAKVYREGHAHLAGEEAKMLTFLKQKTDVTFPEALGVWPPVLVMNFIENDGVEGKNGAAEMGEMLARLHAVRAEKFGFAEDTIFAPTRQPNAWSESWPAFFRDRRLLYMANIAFDAGRIDDGLFSRIEAFAQTLENRLPDAPRASLVHGDFWGGNVLFHQGRCAAFVDPAIYFGFGEVDLAFATLFGAPGDAFFDAYQLTHPIAPGFFEERLDIYNLWPLLFHAYWFGGGYAAQVEGILRKFGA